METVAFPLDGGGQVLVRVDTVDPYGGVVTRGGRAEAAIAEAQHGLENHPAY